MPKWKQLSFLTPFWPFHTEAHSPECQEKQRQLAISPLLSIIRFSWRTWTNTSPTTHTPHTQRVAPLARLHGDPDKAASHLPSSATQNACKHQCPHPCWAPMSAVRFLGWKALFSGWKPSSLLFLASAPSPSGTSNCVQVSPLPWPVSSSLSLNSFRYTRLSPDRAAPESSPTAPTDAHGHPRAGILSTRSNRTYRKGRGKKTDLDKSCTRTYTLEENTHTQKHIHMYISIYKKEMQIIV